MAIGEARLHLGQVVRRAHRNGEYFIVEKNGIPLAGIMNADELEDYLELQDPKVKKQIAQSNEDCRRGRVRDAREFLAELRREGKKRARRT